MLDMEKLARIREQMNRSGRIGEILDAEGQIRPSSTAMQWADREYAGKPEFERYGWAQCMTLLELAEKYRDELS